MPNIPAVWRRYLYILTAATIPILVAYDVITEETAPLWANLAAALLGTSSSVLAIANITPDHGGTDE